MKAKILYSAIGLVMILALAAVVVPAGPALANDIASSTLHFEGALTEAGGVYTGTIAMTEGTYYMTGGPGCVDGQTPDGGPCNGGFDIYAEEGGTGYLHDSTHDPGETTIIGSDHDFYHSGGGWGAYYDPDCVDWYNYELTLTTDHWYLRYNGGVLGSGVATPMSGSMSWSAMYASEDDIGVPSPDPAYPGEAALHGGGSQAWDIDWTWGTEAVPLEFRGFDVEVTDLGEGDYSVTMTPAEEGGEGGCFIATAAYGTEAAAEINVLRAFRDEVLLESTLGSQLVEWYYQNSPPVADFISENSLLRTIVRELVIDPIVSVATFTQGIWGK